MSTDKKIDFILRTVEERDVRYLRLAPVCKVLPKTWCLPRMVHKV